MDVWSTHILLMHSSGTHGKNLGIPPDMYLSEVIQHRGVPVSNFLLSGTREDADKNSLTHGYVVDGRAGKFPNHRQRIDPKSDKHTVQIYYGFGCFIRL